MSTSTKNQTRLDVLISGRSETNVPKNQINITSCQRTLTAASNIAIPPASFPVLFMAAARGAPYALVKERMSQVSQGLKFCLLTRSVHEPRREIQIAEETSF